VANKSTFSIGQVVAECWLYNGHKKEIVVDYEALTRTTIKMVRPQKSSLGTRYWRALTEREKGVQK